MRKHIKLATFGPEDSRRGFYATVTWAGGRLSIVGVEGPRANGDCFGSCGQVAMPSDEHTNRAPFYDRFAEVWKRWHLNDMRPGCEHQRAEWDENEPLEVVTYGLTREAHKLRRAALEEVARAALAGEVAELDYAARFLIGPDWHKTQHFAPDADGPKTGLFEVRKRETKAARWVRPDEHPRGLLSKRCDTCGYAYGTAWKREDVPPEVIEWIESLPDAVGLPEAWS